MKTLKKVFALMLALSMVLALVATSFAEDNQEAAEDAAITVSSAREGETYSLYKIFDLTYSIPKDGNGDKGENAQSNPTEALPEDINVTYTFTKTADNETQFTALSDPNSPFVLTDTLTVDKNGNPVYNVTLIEHLKDGNKFIEGSGEIIGNWLKKNPDALGAMVEDYTVKQGEDKVVFGGNESSVDGLKLGYGYYYISTTQGSLVTVNSAMPTVEVIDKTLQPTIEKYVYEMSSWDQNTYEKTNFVTSAPAMYYTNPNGWETSNDASFEDTVYFTTVVNVMQGALNYKVTDIMDEGLSYGGVIEVALTTSGAVVPLAETTEYVHTTSGNGFEMTFPTLEEMFYQNQEAAVTNPTGTIYITYKATVNENAVINGSGNKNVATLDFGTHNTADDKNEGMKTKVSTTTYVHEFNVFKFFDKVNKIALKDADFALFTNPNCTTESAVKLTEATTSPAAYKYDSTGTINGEVGPDAENHNIHYITTDETGKFNVYGLDSGTYYLKEMDAPAGYNLLKAPIKVVIGPDGKFTSTGDYSYTYLDTTVDCEPNDFVEVLNETGVELPSTGGLGTTLLITFGSIIFMATMVLLVAKKRQYNED